MDPNRNPEIILNWGHPWVPLTAVIIYLTGLLVLPGAFKKPIKLTPIVALWNLGLAIFSFFVFWGTIIPVYRLIERVSLLGPCKTPLIALSHRLASTQLTAAQVRSTLANRHQPHLASRGGLLWWAQKRCLLDLLLHYLQIL